MDEAKKAADAHWGYIRSLLVQHDVSTKSIEQIGFHYTTAFVHGWGHGAEAEAERFVELENEFK